MDNPTDRGIANIAAMPGEQGDQSKDRTFRVLNRALNRYDRRAAAWTNGDPASSIWVRGSTSALAMVKQARDLAGRLESAVYDE
jgi:hypothetical protein